MKKYSIVGILVVFLCLAQMTLGMSKETEERLSGLAGKERFAELSKLVETYKDKEPKKAMEYGREALSLLGAFPDQKGEMDLLNNLSTACDWLGDYLNAEKYGRQSLDIAEKIHDKTAAADALFNISRTYYHQNRYKEAKEWNSRCRKSCEQIRYQEGLADSFQLMGSISWRLGNYAKALEHVLKSIKIYETLRDRKGIANSKNICGTVSSDAGEYQKALDFFQEANQLYELLGEKTGMAMTFNNIGFNYNKLGNISRALEYFRKSLEISQPMGLKSLTSTILINIGEIYEQMKNYPQALDYLNKALKIKEELKQNMWIAKTLIYIGRIKRKLQQYRDSRQLLERALEIATEINIKNEIKTACKELSETFTALGQRRNALVYYKKYQQLDEAIFNQRYRKKEVEIQALYETDKTEKEVSLLKKDSQLQQLELEQQGSLMISFIIIGLLLISLAFLLYTGYRLKSRVSRELTSEIQGHKRTAQELRESEEKFKTLVEKSAAGICIIRDQIIKYANPAFLSIFDYPAGEIIGQSLLKLVADKDQDLVLKRLNQAMSKDSHISQSDTNLSVYEFKGLTRAGKVLYLESYGAKTFFQGLPALLETIIDISARKKTESELLKMRKLESMGILAGNFSYDFYHLLGVVTSNAQQLKKESEISPGLRKMVDRIKDTSLKATALAQMLITFSEGGKALPRKVSLTSVLKSTIAAYPQLQSLIHTTSLSPGLKPIYGDEGELSQVLGNLLWNALEAKDKDREAAVAIAAENVTLLPDNHESLTAGEYLNITIIDNGRGIPANHMDRVFDPYFSTKTTFSQKGLGLGLAICYSIIKKHNGHIAIQSEPGKGTTVRLLVPAYNHDRCIEI